MMFGHVANVVSIVLAALINAAAVARRVLLGLFLLGRAWAVAITPPSRWRKGAQPPERRLPVTKAPPPPLPVRVPSRGAVAPPHAP